MNVNIPGVPVYAEEPQLHKSMLDPTIIETDDLHKKYFESYENLDVHRLMLEDDVRTAAYRNSIYRSKASFEGKIVMDVGAGSGILSLFCAKAGAAKVYAVEASGLGQILPEIAQLNGFADIIHVIHSKVEDVILSEKVDIIVSEWMGFYLLHESMLESVLFARDHFLKPNGLLFPTTAQIYAAPCQVENLWKQQIGFWETEQYEFDLSPISKLAKVRSKPEVHTVLPDGLLSEPQLLWEIDLRSVEAKSLGKFVDRRFFSVDTEDDQIMHGVCVWFVCKFPMEPIIASNSEEDDLQLSTAPWDLQTHWKQTVILFPTPGIIEPGDIIGWDFILEKESLEPGSRAYKLHLEMLGDDAEHPNPCDCGSVKCEIVKHYMSNTASVEDQ